MILIRKEKCHSDLKFFACDSCQESIIEGNTINWIYLGDSSMSETLMLCDKCFKELGEKICQNKDI